MHIVAHAIDQAYQQCVRTCLEHQTSVYIIVAPDVDALCACKILTSLLCADQVPYKVEAVAHYASFKAVLDRLVESAEPDSPISAVLLNCGGPVDLTAFVSLDQHDHVHLYVLDSHRPFSLANVREEHDRVVVISEEETFPSEYIEAPPEDTNEDVDLDDVDELHEGGDDDAGDDDDDGDGGDSAAKRKRSSATGNGGNGNGGNGNGGNGNGGNGNGGTGSTMLDRVRRLRQVRRERVIQRLERDKVRELKAYYSTAWYGRSIAHIMYELSVALNKDTNDLLWLAIVGVTEQFVHERIEWAHYTATIVDLDTQVSSKNVEEQSVGYKPHPFAVALAESAPSGPAASSASALPGSASGPSGVLEMLLGMSSSSSSSSSSGAAADPNSLTATSNNGSMSAPNNPQKSLSSSSHPGMITFRRDEIRLHLLRHWTLIESLRHSPLFCARFSLWTEPGRDSLKMHLVQLGVPLSEANQPWSFVKEDVKLLLQVGWDQRAKSSSTWRESCFGTFVKQFTPSLAISAMDMVLLLSALVEMPFVHDLHATHAGTSMSNDGRAAASAAPGNNSNANNGDGSVDADDLLVRDQERWEENIHVALDALNGKNVKILKDAIERSKLLHESVIRVGTNLIRMRKISPYPHFRLAVLDEGPDAVHVANPTTLHQLALFLYDACMGWSLDNGFASSMRNGRAAAAGIFGGGGGGDDDGAGRAAGAATGAGGAAATNRRAERARRPMIVCCPLATRATYLVTAIQNGMRMGEPLEHNTFAGMFQSIAAESAGGGDGDDDDDDGDDDVGDEELEEEEGEEDEDEDGAGGRRSRQGRQRRRRRERQRPRRRAAASMAIRCRHDMFDRTVVEVAKADFNAFVERLLFAKW